MSVPEWIITGPAADTMGAGGLLGAGYVTQYCKTSSNTKFNQGIGAGIGNGVMRNHGWASTKGVKGISFCHQRKYVYPAKYIQRTNKDEKNLKREDRNLPSHPLPPSWPAPAAEVALLPKAAEELKKAP